MEKTEQEKTLILCEIGMNHMGDEQYANQYIEGIIGACPDGVTFQVREKGYAKQEPGGALYLSDEYYRNVVECLKVANIRFGVGLCNEERVDFFESIGTDFYKILSKDISNKVLTDAVLSTGKPTYVSTGMSDEDDIREFLTQAGPQSNLALIHTQLSYDDEDTNLNAIARLKDIFGVPVAFGSHSTDVNVLYAAMGFNPAALFFYVRGSRDCTHGDEAHAVRLGDLKGIVSELRKLNVMLGSGIKQKMDNQIAIKK